MSQSRLFSLFNWVKTTLQNIFFLHPSTLSYIAWALLYQALWTFPLFKKVVPRLFAEILATDIIINLVSPFIIAAGGFIIATLSKRSGAVPWFAYPVLAAVLGLGLIIPVALMIHMGGWWVLASATLFFSRVNWLYLKHGANRYTALLLIRGIIGPFAFFAPALIIACLYVGRDTLGFENTDWVPLFGTIYFGIQAWFEEFMLRRMGRRESA